MSQVSIQTAQVIKKIDILTVPYVLPTSERPQSYPVSETSFFVEEFPIARDPISQILGSSGRIESRPLDFNLEIPVEPAETFVLATETYSPENNPLVFPDYTTVKTNDSSTVFSNKTLYSGTVGISTVAAASTFIRTEDQYPKIAINTNLPRDRYVATQKYNFSAEELSFYILPAPTNVSVTAFFGYQKKDISISPDPAWVISTNPAGYYPTPGIEWTANRTTIQTSGEGSGVPWPLPGVYTLSNLGSVEVDSTGSGTIDSTALEVTLDQGNSLSASGNNSTYGYSINSQSIPSNGVGFKLMGDLLNLKRYFRVSVDAIRTGSDPFPSFMDILIGIDLSGPSTGAFDALARAYLRHGGSTNAYALSTNATDETSSNLQTESVSNSSTFPGNTWGKVSYILDLQTGDHYWYSDSTQYKTANSQCTSVSVGTVQGTIGRLWSSAPSDNGWQGRIDNFEILLTDSFVNGDLWEESSDISDISFLRTWDDQVGEFISELPTKIDSSYNNVTLLIKSDASNAITDESSYSNTVINSGVTTQEKFIKRNFYSAFFDADYLEMQKIPEWSFGTSTDFTIEFWMHRTGAGTTGASTSYDAIIGANASGSNSWNIYVNNSTNIITLHTSNGVLLTTTNAISDNTWHHIAVTRKNTELRIFIDGAIEYENLSSGFPFDISSSVPALLVGKDTGNANRTYKGYLEDIRITSGVCRYDAAFTPSTLALPAEGTDFTVEITTSYDDSAVTYARDVEELVFRRDKAKIETFTSTPQDALVDNFITLGHNLSIGYTKTPVSIGKSIELSTIGDSTSLFIDVDYVLADLDPVITFKYYEFRHQARIRTILPRVDYPIVFLEPQSTGAIFILETPEDTAAKTIAFGYKTISTTLDRDLFSGLSYPPSPTLDFIITEAPEERTPNTVDFGYITISANLDRYYYSVSNAEQADTFIIVQADSIDLAFFEYNNEVFFGLLDDFVEIPTATLIGSIEMLISE